MGVLGLPSRQAARVRSDRRKILEKKVEECKTSNPRLLSEQEIEIALGCLQGWCRQGNKLHRQYHFSSFEKALAFWCELALIAQRVGHYLEESEIYNSVSVDLTTPEIGGIADIDVKLARQAEGLADSLRLRQ